MHRAPLRPILLALAALVACVPAARAASHDDNVEWSGVSHVPWQDRTPLCPRANESFTIRFQTWHDLPDLIYRMLAQVSSMRERTDREIGQMKELPVEDRLAHHLMVAAVRTNALSASRIFSGALVPTAPMIWRWTAADMRMV